MEKSWMSLISLGQTLEQFKIWMVFDFYCNVPEDEEVESFAEQIELCSASEVHSFFSEISSVEDFRKLEAFKTSETSISKLIEDFSYNDISEQKLYGLLEEENLKEIWKILNCSKTEKDLINKWLVILADAFNNDEFTDLVKCWKNYQ